MPFDIVLFSLRKYIPNTDATLKQAIKKKFGYIIKRILLRENILCIFFLIFLGSGPKRFSVQLRTLASSHADLFKFLIQSIYMEIIVLNRLCYIYHFKYSSFTDNFVFIFLIMLIPVTVFLISLYFKLFLKFIITNFESNESFYSD